MAKRSKEPLKEEDKRPISRHTIRKLLGVFRYMLPYKRTFIAGLISLLLSSFTILAFPFLAGALLDVASGKEVKLFNWFTFTSINQVGVSMLATLFIQSIFSFTRVYTFSIVSERALADLRKNIYERFIWFPMNFFDKHRVGELMSRITSDVSTLQDTFSFSLAELLRQVFTLVLGTLIILFMATKLTVFMLLTFPLLVVSAIVFGKYIRKLSRKTQDKLSNTNIIVEESLQSISVVKAFTNELFEVKRYTESLRDVVNTAIRTSSVRALFISFIIFAVGGGIVAVGWYGATLVQSGMNPGELFSFVMYTIFIGASIGGLGDIYAQFQRAVGASERVLEILEEKGEQETDADEINLNGAICFQDVNFAYPSRPELTVLDNLSFDVRPGEKVALVGQSGSGKTTIISLLMRFYPISNGKILVDEENITRYPLTSYRKNIGIVPQEVILFGGTIKENIAYGRPEASIDEIRLAAQQANALEFIDSFPEKFDTLVGERGVKLSGGQRQRIAIARAILKNPSILILDEATSSLDAQSERLVQDALEKLMESRTTIIIAHRLSTIKKVDRIFVIREGLLAETGSHEELTNLNNGIYSNLLKLQLQ